MFNPYKMFFGVFIPLGLLANGRISQGAKILWGLLAMHAGENGKCFPSQRRLADLMVVGERTIRSYSDELERERLIRVIRVGLNRPNRYQFMWHDCLAECLKRSAVLAERQNSSAPDRNKVAVSGRKDSAAEIDSLQREALKETPINKRTCAPGVSPIVVTTPSVGRGSSRDACRDKSSGATYLPTIRETYRWLEDSGTWFRIGWPPVADAEPGGSVRSDPVAEPLRRAFSAACERGNWRFSPRCKSGLLAKWIEQDGLDACTRVVELAARNWEFLQQGISAIRGRERSLYMIYCLSSQIIEWMDRSKRSHRIPRWTGGRSEECSAEIMF